MPESTIIAGSAFAWWCSFLSYCNLICFGQSFHFVKAFLKEVGKIKMSVGTIAYYQLMQVCQAEYFRQLLKPVT
ncbi:hypothetical protein F0562_018254 [Nyssa sinensis]|uniref:Uncharacterized protein n=1 Tax=Nyssa sinensis TaxID=561372 RepID=A0A5J4ZAJ3_9ASTE|nr:hypothetical protein F0562_018254 [Nyssa sinensis]